MLKKDVLQQLFAASDDLSRRIIQSSPQNAAEQERFNDLMDRRDRVNGAVHAVIVAGFDEFARSEELVTALGRLDEATARLEQLANTLAAIDDAIAIADQIVGVVVQIIKLAAL